MSNEGGEQLFGYVKAYKPELRIWEFETYKSIYCGLCKEMGRRFGLWSRFTLSYDFTFLALLSMSLAPDDPAITPGRCTFNPLKKANCCHSNDSLGYAADVAILMLWHKLADNRRDGGWAERTAAGALAALLKKGYRDAADKHPDIAAVMEKAMEEQAALEAEQCTEPDRICHPSAHMLGTVLEALSAEPAERRVLYRMGYLMGRYVYLSDALDDLEQDAKSGGYNPLLLSQSVPEPGESLRERAKGSLYLTIAEAGNAYELLTPQRFGSILENIIFLGLRKNVDYIVLPHGDRPRNQKF